MNVPEIVNCSNVSKNYGTLAALKSISFSMHKGEAVALVGANGAGKTTLFNIILGLLRPDEGVCSILDTTSDRLTPGNRGRIGFIADHAGPIPWTSAHELAALYAKIYPAWDGRKFEDAVASWNIDKYRRLNNLSKGQKRLAEIALITAMQPQIVILDEPFDGLDAVIRIRVQKHLRSMRKEGNTAILYATHIISELSSVADRMMVLKAGSLIYDTLLSDDTEPPEERFRRLYAAEMET